MRGVRASLPCERLRTGKPDAIILDSTHYAQGENYLMGRAKTMNIKTMVIIGNEGNKDQARYEKADAIIEEGDIAGKLHETLGQLLSGEKIPMRHR